MEGRLDGAGLGFDEMCSSRNPALSRSLFHMDTNNMIDG